MRRCWMSMMAAFLLAGCNLGLPQVTPTIAPTRTASQTPSPLPPDAPTLTQTATAIALLPSATFPATATATSTGTATETATLSPTPAPTVTETLPAPTPAPTVAPTVTPLPTIGPSRTPIPTTTATASATFTLTPIPAPSSTPAAFAPIGERPQEFPQATLIATPTFVTGEPSTTVASALPTAADALPPTTIPLALPPTAITVQAVTPIALSAPDTRAFALNVSNGIFSGLLLNMPGGTFEFAQDPLDGNRLALVDARGLLFIFSDFAGDRGARVASSPFSQPEPTSAETNNARVTQIAYAPDGHYLAFLIDTDSDESHDNDSSNDGIWVLPLDVATGAPTGGSAILLRDCPPEAGCMIVERPDAPYEYRSQSMVWSPLADALLIALELPEEGRQGIAIVYPAAPDATTRPPVLRYDYGSWSNDGQRLVVSGRDPDGRIVVGTVDRGGGAPQLRDAGSIGLGWAQSAVQRPDGTIVFLGSVDSAGGPLSVYNWDGAALTGPIGSERPSRVAWSPDRSAVLVTIEANGQIEHYVALLDSGEVRRITDQAAGVTALAWTQTALPGTNAASSGLAPAVPSPTIVERTALVIASDGLFVRSAPSLEAEAVASVLANQTVVITGESVVAEGVIWYPARAPDGANGWIAGEIGGVAMLQF
ncbi:MAG: SH3 domain-containing protein [Anaerolineae bacterium]|nr:SH3 domain-containing protein [Anaerolineae bacterium]